MRSALFASRYMVKVGRLLLAVSLTVVGFQQASGQGTFIQPDPCQSELADVQPVTPQSCPLTSKEALGIQRLIVAQVRQDDGLSSNDDYAKNVTYKSDGTGSAPWFDWGPYFWAGGPNNPRGDGLIWCDGQGGACAGEHDFRWGEPGLQGHPLNGDHIHPAEFGVEQTAGIYFLNWLTDPSNAWVYPWSHKN